MQGHKALNTALEGQTETATHSWEKRHKTRQNSDEKAKADSYSKDRIFTFRGEWAWHPPDNATPSNFLFPKSLDQELPADVSFVSVLAIVLS